MDEEQEDAAAPRPAPDGGRDGDRDGDPGDRGNVEAIGVDLSKLRDHGDFQPAVEYLTAIQDMRGDGSSLLFVRGDDLDAMAERDGVPVPEFLDRLDQLGVVVSNN